MARRAQPKAYVLTLGKLTITVDTLNTFRDNKATKHAWDELTDWQKGKLKIDRITGNKKFVLSDKAAVAEFKAVLVELEPAAKARAVKAEAKEEAEAKVQQAKWDREEAARAAKYRAELAAFVKKAALPDGITLNDLTRAENGKSVSSKELSLAFYGYESDYGPSTFELWYTERFGWVAPTLTIRGAGRRHGADAKTRRTYAVAIKGGALCRVGMGPHVLKTVKVYITKDNIKRLKATLALIVDGSKRANEARDELSSRRAFGRRGYYGY